MPNLLMIHEAVSQDNAIGKVALAEVKIALSAGYKVTVISKLLDPSLKAHVKWHPLFVPSRLFYLQWTTARRFIKRALARAQAADGPFDIIHAHQPQVADLADIFQCHFLTRVAYERHCLESRTTLRARFVRLQQLGVLRAEDRCFQHWNKSTHMLYCSGLLQDEFRRLYGQPPLETVIVNPAPELPSAPEDKRDAARARFAAIPPSRIIAGYIGGLDERKGYRRIIDNLRQDTDISILFGGPFSGDFHPAGFNDRLIPLGLVKDMHSFFNACDVLLVPSYFDPCPLVVFEAAANGIPIIVTDGVGNASNVLASCAGLLWNGTEPIAPMIRSIVQQRDRFRKGAIALAKSVSLQHFTRHLLNLYESKLAIAPQPAQATLASLTAK